MPDARIRVLIDNIPEMLSEILIATLSGDREIKLLISREDSELRLRIGRLHPDVVIAGHMDTAVLYEAPRLQAYLLGPDAHSIHRVELRSVSEEVGNLSLEQLVAAIKMNKVQQGDCEPPQ